MTEVKGATSPKDAVSVGEKQYDLRSWQGLTAVLGRARDAKLDEAEYASFRDMVLSYAQSGGDASLRERINAKIASWTSEPKKEKGTDEVIPEKKPDSNQKHKKIPGHGISHEQKLRPVRPVPVFAPTPTKPKEQSRGHTIPHIEQPAPIPFTQPQAQPELVAAVVEVPPPPAPVISQMPVEPQDAPHKSIEAHKVRISEIKRIVHNTVGNPVTLMDANNQIGRAYMNALLTAMKATGGGSPLNVDTAMAELERTFEAVLSLNQAKSPASVEAPQAEAIATPVGTEPVPATPIPSSTHNEEPVAAEVKEVVETPPVRAAIPIEPPMNLPVDAMSASEELPAVSAVPEVADSPLEQPVEDAAAAIAVAQEIPNTVVAETHTGEPDESTSARAVGGEGAGVMSSWASILVDEPATIAPREQVSEPPRFQAPSTAVASSTEMRRITGSLELDTPEVSAALGQLLNEWKIFSSSGFLGFGPSGKDHPLYMHLAPLPMMVVANGDWEDATHEEKQSMRDYINAWRHEQGVTYNPTESFEHYLRRVVQRVLRRQKSSTGA